jgi:hypothetical protein
MFVPCAGFDMFAKAPESSLAFMWATQNHCPTLALWEVDDAVDMGREDVVRGAGETVNDLAPPHPVCDREDFLDIPA